MPAPHAAHVVEVHAAATLEYVPVRQTVQTLVPSVNELYNPAAHAVHSSEVVAWLSLPYFPAVHAVHAAEVPAVATLEYAPVAHAVHDAEVDEPSSSLYLPAEQLVQRAKFD